MMENAQARRVWLFAVTVGLALTSRAGAASPCDRPSVAAGDVGFHGFALDPEGARTRLIWTQSADPSEPELMIRAICRSVARQIEDLKSRSAPRECAGFVDSIVPKAEPGGEVRFDLDRLPWDPRRCVSASAVSTFKIVLRQALSGRFAHSGGWHTYTGDEMRRFLRLAGAPCQSMPTLYERYACSEANGRRIFADYRAAKAALDARAPARSKLGAGESLTGAQACALLKDQKLGAGEIDLLARVARNQYRPPGLSAKDYPAYTDCRGFDFPAVLTRCGDAKLDPTATYCLSHALAFLGEDTAAFTSGPMSASRTGPYRLHQTLSVLRQRALELSVFSRICAAGLDPSSVFDASMAPLTDKDTRERCMLEEIAKLKALTDTDAWLAEQEKLNPRGDGYVPAIAVGDACREEPQDSSPSSDAGLHSTAADALRLATISSALVDEPPTKDKPKASPAPQAPLTAPLTKDQLRNRIHLTFANRVNDPKVPEKGKQALKNLIENPEYLDRLIRHYAEQSKNWKLDDEKALEKIDSDLGAALETVLETAAEKENEKKEAEKQKKEQEKKLAEVSGQIKQNVEIPPPPKPEAKPELSQQEKRLVAAAKVRPVGEIIRDAQAVLQGFKDGKPAAADWGALLLEGEAADMKPPPAEERYRALVEQWLTRRKEYQEYAARLTGTAATKILVMAEKLNKDFLWRYRRENARIYDLLRGAGGNCDAETRLVLSVLHETGLIPNDGGTVVAAQVFDDHIQPVIYDRKSKTVTSLVSGGKITGLVAPLYRPELLFEAYLEGKEAPSPVSARELLIEDITPETRALARKAGWGHPPVSTNSSLRFPGGGGVFFSNGEIPPEAFITMNGSGGASTNARAFFGVGRGGGALGGWRANIGAPREEESIVMYDQLKSDLERVLRMPEFQLYLDILNDPTVIATRNITDAEITRIHWVDTQLGRVLRGEGYTSGPVEADSRKGFARWQAELSRDYPQLRALDYLQNGLSWRIHNYEFFDPDKAVALFDAMGLEKFEVFRHLLKVLDPGGDGGTRMAKRISAGGMDDAYDGNNAWTRDHEETLRGALVSQFLDRDRLTYEAPLQVQVERRAWLAGSPGDHPGARAPQPDAGGRLPNATKKEGQDLVGRTGQGGHGNSGGSQGPDASGIDPRHKPTREIEKQVEKPKKGYGDQEKGSESRPEPAAVEIPPLRFAELLMMMDHDFWQNGKGLRSTVFTAGERWTPAFSEALLFKKTYSEELATWFLADYGSSREADPKNMNDGVDVVLSGRMLGSMAPPQKEMIPWFGSGKDPLMPKDLARVFLFFLRKKIEHHREADIAPTLAAIREKYATVENFIRYVEKETARK